MSSQRARSRRIVFSPATATQDCGNAEVRAHLRDLWRERRAEPARRVACRLPAAVDWHGLLMLRPLRSRHPHATSATLPRDVHRDWILHAPRAFARPNAGRSTAAPLVFTFNARMTARRADELRSTGSTWTVVVPLRCFASFGRRVLRRSLGPTLNSAGSGGCAYRATARAIRIIPLRARGLLCCRLRLPHAQE